MSVLQGVMTRTCAARPLLRCLPGHKPQQLLSLKQWPSSNRASRERDSARCIATRVASTAEPVETDSVGGAGVLKAQVQSKLGYRAQLRCRTCCTFQ